jgi:DNA recombination protein RmuC
VVGTLERRVLVSARRLRDLGVADSDLPEIELIQGVPRNVTASELVEEARGDTLFPPLRRDASGE